jgi:hypothetical protein
MKLTLHAWLIERAENAEQIARRKVGEEHEGWLEDAAYFREAAALVPYAGAQREALELIVSICMDCIRTHYGAENGLAGQLQVIASDALAKIPTPPAIFSTEASVGQPAEASGAGGAGTPEEPHDCSWCKTRHVGYSIADCAELTAIADKSRHETNSEPKRTFSDFIRNAEGEERAKVFERVIDRSIERQQDTLRHQSGKKRTFADTEGTFAEGESHQVGEFDRWWSSAARGTPLSYAAVERMAREAFEAGAATRHAINSQTCAWTEDETHGKWDAACGLSWTFEDAGPEDNGVRFCFGCGKPVSCVHCRGSQ